MMEIPKTLQNENIRFCKIRKGTKKPFEKNWTKIPYSAKEIEEWLKESDAQYGILCGYGNLAVIDADNVNFQTAIENMFPDTYRVKTGSGGTHNYFFIPDLKQKIILHLDDPDNTHLGEVQSLGTQVVGVGSIHPNGKKYEELNQIPIATISCEELYEKLRPFMKKEIETSEMNSVYERQQSSEIDNLSVTDIWGLSGMKKMGDEYYGCHPIHSSAGGMNFWINPLKNTWHCFRCDSGGGVLSAIGVKHGIIDCSDAKKGNLRGDKAIQCIEIAKQHYGLKDDFNRIIENPKNPLTMMNKPMEIKPVEPIKVIWDKELKDYQEEDKEWIVEKLIPTKSVCIITGKRGTMKTFLTLSMGYSITSGQDFLNKFSTRKGKVLYLDKENGVGIIKQRASMLKKGMELENLDLPLGFICFSQLKIDKSKDIQQIEDLIKEHKPILLVIDTYRRGISFDENDAGEVSKLFVDTLRPLVEKYDLSIVLIHHNRKGEPNGDEMDMLRGSSDLANYSDIILSVERKEKKLVLKQLKNRNAQEEDPFQINYEMDEDSAKFWFNGEYLKKNKSEMFIEDILIWVSKNKLKDFGTKDIKELALQKGVKKNNMHNALMELQSRGFIVHQSYGKYEIIQV